MPIRLFLLISSSRWGGSVRCWLNPPLTSDLLIGCMPLKDRQQVSSTIRRCKFFRLRFFGSGHAEAQLFAIKLENTFCDSAIIEIKNEAHWLPRCIDVEIAFADLARRNRLKLSSGKNELKLTHNLGIGFSIALVLTEYGNPATL